MSRKNLNIFRLFPIVLIASLASHSPRYHVEGRSLKNFSNNGTDSEHSSSPFTTDANPFAAENAIKASDSHHSSTYATTTAETITEATTVVTDLNNPTTQESYR